MPIIVNEQRATEGLIDLRRDIQTTPLQRFIEGKSPTFVTYYHINNDETTTDAGFIDVASILGHRSPIRFNKVVNFPIYGIEEIKLQLEEDDQGLDTTYNGEAVILPGTIKPLQNDMFIINELEDSYVFRVTGIDYASIMPDNYYQINFKLDYLDDEYLEKLEKQVLENYSCVLNNIGTENNCIVETETLTAARKVEEMYNTICDFYKRLFYNKRHNSFLAPLENGHSLYDPMQTKFINKHGLFNSKNNFECMMLTEQYNDPKQDIKYAKSVYRYLELRKEELLQNFRYTTFPGITIQGSSFHLWFEKGIEVLDIPSYVRDDFPVIFSDEYVSDIRYNAPDSNNTNYGNLIKGYLREEELHIKDIPLNLDEELLYFNDCLEVFFFTPIILYVIREIINSEI